MKPTATDVFNEFLKLDELQRNAFFATLMMHTDLNLPDGTFIEYEVAKQVMHSFGLPYRHPVTGKKIPPPKRRRKR